MPMTLAEIRNGRRGKDAADPSQVWVVSEDAPGVWRVVDQIRARVAGPFRDEMSALRVAFSGVRAGRQWEVHVVNQTGKVICSCSGTH